MVATNVALPARARREGGTMVGSARSYLPMAKPIAKRRHDEAERAFRKAWKLLDRIERRLERARAEERKRVTQLGDGMGPDAPRRSAQLEAARAEIAQIEGLLTELSELITRNARASSGQTVKDMAHSVAAEIKDEAAEPPQLPARSRNRHHRPRRKPAGADAASASASADSASASADSATASTDGSTPIALPPPLAGRSIEKPTAPAVPPSAPAQAPRPAPKPAPAVYRSLVSQPPDRRWPDRPAADAAVPDEAADAAESSDAARPTDEPTSAADPAPDADRDDSPAQGA
jgi:hypothetical protein